MDREQKKTKWLSHTKALFKVVFVHSFVGFVLAWEKKNV